MNRRAYILLILAFVLAATGRVAFAATEREIFEIYLPFERGAEVRAVLPDGRAWTLGHVTELPERTRWPSYTASAWGLPGTVTASAVNAVHILIGVEEGQGRTMTAYLDVLAGG